MLEDPELRAALEVLGDRLAQVNQPDVKLYVQHVLAHLVEDPQDAGAVTLSLLALLSTQDHTRIDQDLARVYSLNHC